MSSLDDLYRKVIMDHYQKPRNYGELGDADATIELKNPTCGDHIQLQLKVEDDKVMDVKFKGEGCSISMSSASMMTDAVKGLTLDQALDMSSRFYKMIVGETVDTDDFEDIEALQGVSKFPARIKCATLAWKALEKSVKENHAHNQDQQHDHTDH